MFMGNQGKYKAVHRPECIKFHHECPAATVWYYVFMDVRRPQTYKKIEPKTLCVTEEGARTLDHKVKSLALYQLSYSGPACVPGLG